MSGYNEQLSAALRLHLPVQLDLHRPKAGLTIASLSTSGSAASYSSIHPTAVRGRFSPGKGQQFVPGSPRYSEAGHTLTPPKAGWSSLSGAAGPSSDWDADLVIHFPLFLLALPVGSDVSCDCLIQTARSVLILLLNAFSSSLSHFSPECNQRHILCHVLC